MFCGNCGKPLSEGALFCPECGTPVKKIETENVNVEETTASQSQSDPMPQPNNQFGQAYIRRHRSQITFRYGITTRGLITHRLAHGVISYIHYCSAFRLLDLFLQLYLPWVVQTVLI